MTLGHRRYLIDTCGWLEHYRGSAVGRRFSPYVDASTPELAVTSPIVLYELFKKLKGSIGDRRAVEELLHLQSVTRVIDISAAIALLAADIAGKEGLAMADALILATGRVAGSTVLTLESKMGGLEGADDLSKRS